MYICVSSEKREVLHRRVGGACLGDIYIGRKPEDRARGWVRGVQRDVG